MFCNNCGKNLADGAKFCDACGAQVGVATGEVTTNSNLQVETAENPIFKDTLKTVKGFFSKNTVKTIGDAAKSQGMEWTVLGLISMLVYALALAVNVKQILESALGIASEFLINSLYKFGTWFLYGLLISAGTYFLTSILMYAAIKLIFKKSISFRSVLNLVAAASLPMTTAYLINIIFGFIWIPAVIIFSAASVIATSVLLYIGMQKLEKIEKSPFAAYVGIMTMVIAVIVIAVVLAVKSAVDGAISDITSSLTGTLTNGLLNGGVSDLIDLFT